jgi:hypothetical protein
MFYPGMRQGLKKADAPLKIRNCEARSTKPETNSNDQNKNSGLALKALPHSITVQTPCKRIKFITTVPNPNTDPLTH